MPITQSSDLFEMALTNASVGKLGVWSRPIVDQKMTNAKRILITTESHETFTLHINSKNGAVGRCDKCDAQVEILSLEQAVSLTHIHTRDLVRLVDTAQIHAIETNTGHYLICSTSANKYLRERAERRKNHDE
jgi:hypothetical protein